MSLHVYKIRMLIFLKIFTFVNWWDSISRKDSGIFRKSIGEVQLEVRSIGWHKV